MKNIWKTDMYTLKRALHKIFEFFSHFNIKKLPSNFSEIQKFPSTTLTVQNSPKLKIRFMDFPVDISLSAYSRGRGSSKNCKEVPTSFLDIP